MKRIRKLGLGVAMALALMASVGVASAAASEFATLNQETGEAEYPASVAGEPSGGDEIFSIGALSDGCDTPMLAASIEDASQSITTPIQSFEDSCSNHDIKLSNCNFIFHPGAQKTAKEFGGTMDLDGASCSIKLGLCKTTVGPQSGLQASYRNFGEGNTAKVEVTLTASKIKNTREYTPLCGSAGTYEDLSWSAHWQLRAENIFGESIGLHVDPLAGLYLEGGKFQSQDYPLVVSGDQPKSEPLVLTVGTFSMKCQTAHFEAVLSSASASLDPLNAEYAACKTGEVFQTSFEMGSCHYAFNAAGSMDVACSKEGDSIKIVVHTLGGLTKCTLTIPAQGGVNSIGFTNLAETNSQGKGVEANLKVEGIKYTTSGTSANCGGKPTGTYTDATYRGSIGLYAGI